MDTILEYIPFNKIYLDIRKKDSILKILLTISILVAIGMVIYVITVPKVGEKFTEFYILNSSTHKADNYDTNLKIGQPVTYLIGVINHEYSNINFTIETSIGEDILYYKKLTLVNNQIWEDNLTITPHRKGKDMELKFLLFKESNFASPYRELHLWINVF